LLDDHPRDAFNLFAKLKNNGLDRGGGGIGRQRSREIDRAEARERERQPDLKSSQNNITFDVGHDAEIFIHNLCTRETETGSKKERAGITEEDGPNNLSCGVGVDEESHGAGCCSLDRQIWVP
jgi:hypothetical protein